MDKLKIASFAGVIKRNPAVLSKTFSPDTFIFSDNEDDVINKADIFVQTNLIKIKFFDNYRHKKYLKILESGKPKLVLESPVFRSVNSSTKKTGLIRLGWNSYQYHNADYNNTNSVDDRWKYLSQKYSLVCKDWKTQGEHILFTLQKPGDSSLNDIYTSGKTYWQWVEETIKKIRQVTDRKIVLRPHINQQSIAKNHASVIAEMFDNVVISKNYKWLEQYGASGGDGLQEDLKNAHCCVTYNSLSGIEAVMSGTPVIALHNGAMCYPVAHHHIDQIENLDRTKNVNQWLYDLSYTTWEGPEMANGTAWNHLRPRYEFWKKQVSKNKIKDIAEYKLLQQAHANS